eukprot:m.1421617 g.1421617  ORF g.1421617 m.1421617 type:complete len:72 (-) comp25047_c0_seq34:2144-2359(-)
MHASTDGYPRATSEVDTARYNTCCSQLNAVTMRKKFLRSGSDFVELLRSPRYINATAASMHNRTDHTRRIQ